MKNEPAAGMRPASLEMFSATMNSATVHSTNTNQDAVPAMLATTATDSAGVSVGETLATDWPSASKNDRLSLRNSDIKHPPWLAENHRGLARLPLYTAGTLRLRRYRLSFSAKNFLCKYDLAPPLRLVTR